ncbi:MAG: CCA tRNA nucleotidyltransferase, partial [Candidatus Micrarchaeota archaeon]
TLRAKWETHYAEHPYLQAKIGGYKVEVIPCFRIGAHEGIKSAVDRSPLHMAFLQERLTQEQRKDVRILKQFLKNAGLYGAELAVQGFSGLLCEYLILNYRTLEGLVENASKWRPPVLVEFDPADSDRKTFDAPLVVIDAIDRNRNVAAVVSETNVHRFISLCRAFWESPGDKFFFLQRKPPSVALLRKKIKERKTQFTLIELRPPELVEDILIPQLRRTQKTLERHLQLAGFSVFGSHSFCAARKCFILFEVLSDKTPGLKRENGPPVANEKAVAQFLKARKTVARGPFVDGERVSVEIVIKQIALKNFLKKAFGKPEKMGVASFLIKPIRKARLFENERILQKHAVGGIAEYLLKREFWW